ncbi:SDR family oxidoreductase [Luteimonas sp. MC1782]|uniref:SDR family NAD(P)-dependent oxidoreductase n=1 Tax=Luteimonas sp. MC1782 TaxID=2760305 RepID=UPI001601CC91|nr:SDR family oxidoreductase [Luteimonas sp. MC1782]MBB1473205.1 SDR family oxidoreductase [Luteimonas sp. MC1782]
MDLELQGKAAIVTGAASGIGRAIALALSREGAHLVLADIDAAGCEQTLALMREARAQAQGVVVRADAALLADHEATVAAALEAFGGLDIAVNNAGIGGEAHDTAEMSPEGWRKVIDINLNGVFYAMHAQLPALLARGGGAIVNLASILGATGWRTASAYVASKHGVVGLTKTAALEYATRGIRINAVGPGFVETPIIGEDPKVLAHLASLHPVQRLGQPAEVGDLVAYLASARASLVTGAYYPVDGGYLAQ